MQIDQIELLAFNKINQYLNICPIN